MVLQLKLIKVPSSATVGYSFVNGDSFTSSNPNVATFNAKGELVAGDEGTTVITVTTPQNVTKTMTVNVPITKVEVKGISAPVVGEKLDTSAILPTNANYSIMPINFRQIQWQRLIQIIQYTLYSKKMTVINSFRIRI